MRTLPRLRFGPRTVVALLALGLVVQGLGWFAGGTARPIPEEGEEEEQATEARVEGPRRPPAPRGVPAPRPREAAFRASRSVLGQVLGLDRAPQGRARVRLLDPGEEGAPTETEADEKGWFRLDGLPLRPCWVEAQTERLVSGPVLVPAGRTDPMPIWVGASARIAGRVASLGSTSLGGLDVTVVLEGTDGPVEFVPSVRTDPEGRFVLAGLRRDQRVGLRFRDGGRLVRELPPFVPSPDGEMVFPLDE